MQQEDLLIVVYKKLFTKFGPQYWWPAQTKFEIILTPQSLKEIPIEELSILIVDQCPYYTEMFSNNAG